jgi:hypothetical protein
MPPKRRGRYTADDHVKTWMLLLYPAINVLAFGNSGVQGRRGESVAAQQQPPPTLVAEPGWTWIHFS